MLRLLAAIGLATAIAGAASSGANPVSTIMSLPTVEAECHYLLELCLRGRAARAAGGAGGYVEHLGGVVIGTSNRAADHYVGGAAQAAAAMRIKHGAAPACIAECNALLQRR